MLRNESLNFFSPSFLSELDDIKSVDGKLCDDLDLFTPRKVFDLSEQLHIFNVHMLLMTNCFSKTLTAGFLF